MKVRLSRLCRGMGVSNSGICAGGLRLVFGIKGICYFVALVCFNSRGKSRCQV